MKHNYYFLIIFLFSSLFSYAQQQPVCNPFPKTITVTGTSEMEIIPDEIYVQVDLNEYKKKGEEKVDLEKIKTSFLSNCKMAGIPDSNISIKSYGGANTSYSWKRKKSDPDLLSSISYIIKFSNSKQMDKLVEKLDDDATTDFKIVRTSHSRISEFKKQLKIAAIKAAKEKAIYLTEAIGEKIDQAITIEEPIEQTFLNQLQLRYSNTISQSNLGTTGDTDEGNDQTDFNKIKLQFSVTIVYSLAPKF